MGMQCRNLSENTEMKPNFDINSMMHHQSMQLSKHSSARQTRMGETDADAYPLQSLIQVSGSNVPLIPHSGKKKVIP
jgi:hypothetical protein